MEYVAAILLIWASGGSHLLRIDVSDMQACKAMQEQILAQNTFNASLHTQCVGIPNDPPR
jgi:hypothetical protein